MRSLEELATRLAFLKKHLKIILIWLVILTIAVFIGFTWLGIKSDTLVQPYRFYSPKDFREYRMIIGSYSFKSFIQDLIQELRQSAYTTAKGEKAQIEEPHIVAIKNKAIFDLIFSSGLSLAFVVSVIAVLWRRDIGLDDERYLRGASLVSPSLLNSSIKKYRITIGKEKVRFPESYENMGVFIFGSPGYGKTTFLKHLLKQINNDPAVIYDRKPEFYPMFYSLGKDILLDPLDERSVQWDIFREIRVEEDIDSIVNSLIPKPTDPKDAFWYQATQDIFKTILKKIWLSKKASNKKLIEFLYQYGSNREKLFEMLKDDPRIHGYLSKENNTSNSIMAVVSQFSNALIQRYFYYEGDFSVRDFIKEGRGRIFVVNRYATEETFKVYYTLFFDLCFKEFLNRPINRSFRFWFIIDEFPSLMRLETLQKLLAEGRDRGSCPVLGAQDFQQVKKNYGMDAFSIFNQTSTKLTFKINDPDTAEYISRAFGEQEYITPVKTMTASTRSMRDGYNFSEQQRIRRIILPSEISGLKPLRGFVWIGEYPVTKISFDIFNQANRFSLIPKPVPEIDAGHEQLIEEETDALLS